jgi:hypothetical protein
MEWYGMVFRYSDISIRFRSWGINNNVLLLYNLKINKKPFET